MGTAIDARDHLILATVSEDYAAGSLAVYDPTTGALIEQILTTSGDPRVRRTATDLIQINALGTDTVRLYPLDNLATAPREFGLTTPGGPVANAVDAYTCGDTLWVATYARSTVSRIDLTTGELREPLSLDAYADGDDVGPEPVQLLPYGDDLLLVLQRLDRNNQWSAVGSQLLHIDCASAQIIETWPLGANSVVALDNEAHILFTDDGSRNEAPGVFRLDLSTGVSERLISTDGPDGLVPRNLSGPLPGLLMGSAPDGTADRLWCIDADGTVIGRHSFDGFVTSVSHAPATQRGWAGLHWGWRDPKTSLQGLFELDLLTCEPTADSPRPMVQSPYHMAAP